MTLVLHHFVHNPEIEFVHVQTGAQTSFHIFQISSKLSNLDCKTGKLILHSSTSLQDLLTVPGSSHCFPIGY